MISEAAYQSWLLDVSRGPYRQLAIELDYSGGTLRLASTAMTTDTNLSFDDWLIGSPYLENSLENFIGVGDIEAINNIPEEDWNERYWHGHQCRWYHGDLAWKFEDYKRIATATIDDCIPKGGRRYQFDLLDNGHRLSQFYVSEDVTKILTVQEAVDWIVETTGQTISFSGVQDPRLEWDLQFEVTTRTTIEETLRGIARSVGGFLRVDQLGNVQIIQQLRRSTTTATETDIVGSALEVVEKIPPYRVVNVVKYDGTIFSDVTRTDTGELSVEYTHDTYLINDQNAERLLSELINYYVNTHTVWSVPMIALSNRIKVGDMLIVDHPELRRQGLVRRLRRTPLSRYSVAEVEV